MKSPFNMLAKPIGPQCNMKCSYCFYSEKIAFVPECGSWKMTAETLERYISSYIASSPGREVSFVWQGGEPLLAGLDFYQKAIRLQRKYADGKIIKNAIQTNGTLLTEEWCQFLHTNHFLVGVSLDGPARFHDQYRSMQGGQPSFDSVLSGIRLMQRSGVEFNVTACVTRESSEHPEEVYRFFKENGIRYIQFAPIVERLPDREEAASGLWHAQPDLHHESAPAMFPGSVTPEGYGRFLCAVFDEWISKDVGHIFVMNFEWALERWMNLPASYCLFGTQCGHALAVEHNGDVYSCDHFVYPEYYVGNLSSSSTEELVQRSLSGKLSGRKADLTSRCRKCPFRFACEGECPKNRFIPTSDGKGLNYLCEGYRMYFRHIGPKMEQLKKLIISGRPISSIMK